MVWPVDQQEESQPVVRPVWQKKRTRRSSRTARRSRTGRRRSHGHKKVSIQRLQTLLPDVAVCKLNVAGVFLTKKCIDWNENLFFAPGVILDPTNGVIIALNSNPNGGPIIWRDNAVDNSLFNPVQTYMTKYKRYRCHAARVQLEFIYADSSAEDGFQNMIARPFTVCGFLFKWEITTWPTTGVVATSMVTMGLQSHV